MDEFTALAVLRSLVREFPGLVNGETEVNGADLVGSLTDAIKDCPDLADALKAGG